MVGLEEKIFKTNSEMAGQHYSDISYCKYSKNFLYVRSTVVQAIHSPQVFKNCLILTM